MHPLFSALISSLISCSLFGQSYTIKTIAGGGWPPPPVNVPGVSAGIGQTRAVALDPAGNVFITSYPLQCVLRLDAITGILTLAAGNGTPGFSGDNGPATSAQLSNPNGVAVDSAGNLYIADRDNYRIRKVSNGVITTVAGNGTNGFSGDNGPATSASLYPIGVAVDSAGNLYIADPFFRIRKVSNGVITTVAGGGPYSPDLGDNGPATSAYLKTPSGVALDSAGNLYIADFDTGRVRKVSNGVITTVAGGGSSLGDNGPATSAQVSPAGVAVDSAGNLYIADLYNDRVRKVSNGVITTVAGNGTFGFSGDNGPATSAQLYGPRGVAVDSAGNLYIADLYNDRVRKVSNGVITTVAGNGTFADDNVAATSSLLNRPAGVAVDSAGNLYVADSYNARVRKVSNGVITTVAGNGTFGFRGDNGPATSAQLVPIGVAVDSAGNLYIADLGNYRIRKVSNGVITTVAGGGTAGLGDNGPATSAELSAPHGVAVDSAGNLYIADTFNYRIRKVSNGVITTVAGNGTFGFSGDNGPATSAQLSNPFGVAVDSAGNLYIADTENQRIRKVSNGVITTVAGGGSSDYPDDIGPATSATLGLPVGVVVDNSGNLYIADAGNGRIRKVSNGLITTIAGGGSAFGDNGPALNAQLFFYVEYDMDGNVFSYLPAALAVDANGAVYIPDTAHDRVRILTPFTPPFPVCTVTSAASNHSWPIAPGEIVVLYGPGLGPAQLTQSQLGDNGLVPTQLAGTSVSFNGIPAPILYTSATQVAAVVPYAVSGATAEVIITYQGQTVAATTANVVAAAPALFTSDGSGKGQAAAVNQDGSLNTAATPAKAGDVITLFATGEGQTTPAGVDGKPASAPLPKPLLPVSVYIGGQRAEVQYYGGAPGEVAGVMQVNVKIPSSVSGNVPIVLQVGNAFSQPGVTIAVSGK